MKENTQPAAFSFDRYIVRKFSFNQPLEDQNEISIDFEPIGEYDISMSVFKLTLNFTASYGPKRENTLLELEIEGYFKFHEVAEKEAIPEYFYSNSIAILFPYLRAFLTTTTSVANTKPLILPTLNLSSLAVPLKQNTKISTA